MLGLSCWPLESDTDINFHIKIKGKKFKTIRIPQINFLTLFKNVHHLILLLLVTGRVLGIFLLVIDAHVYSQLPEFSG